MGMSERNGGHDQRIPSQPMFEAMAPRLLLSGSSLGMEAGGAVADAY